MTAPILALYTRLTRWPAGHWLFSRAVCFKAPYFATIAPTIVRLDPGHCEAVMGDRRRVHNHIGTVHAIALCNLAELVAGVMTDASLPDSMRWIPKGMNVHYLKRAQGTQRAVGSFTQPIRAADAGYELPVNVDVYDPAGERVFNAQISRGLSPARPR